MKYILTGSGAIWTARASSCALINGNIAFDLPNGTCKAMLRQGRDARNADHVIISHLHGDHVLDVPVWALGKVKNGAPPVKPVIYAPQSFVQPLKQLMTMAFGSSLSADIVEEQFRFVTEDEFNIGALSVKRLPVQHGDIEAYGYILTEGDTSLGLTGDTCLCPAVEQMARGCTALICEAALVEAKRAHMGVKEIAYLCEKYPQCRFITTHMGDEALQALSALDIPNLTVGFDGLEGEI